MKWRMREVCIGHCSLNQRIKKRKNLALCFYALAQEKLLPALSYADKYRGMGREVGLRVSPSFPEAARTQELSD